jgi:uracil-DNA glycosylase
MSMIVDPLIHWHIEFAKVISCAKCSKATDPNLMRDSNEHVPQPGYIGEGYGRAGLLLVGQNPYLPNVSLASQDRDYTAALRALRDAPTEQQYARLQVTLYRFIPKWPVQNNYFPLMECGLSLKDIAYLNLVRCRTGDKAPNANTVEECRRTHFEPWLEMLNPTCVVFIGIWACERGRNAVAARRIPYATIDRNRSLNSSQRIKNRVEAAAFVRANLRSPRETVSGSTGILPSPYRLRPAQKNEMEMDPKRTLPLLDELQKLGFDDEAFWRLHHFRHRKRETIARFRAYCEKSSAFLPDGANERVHRRLAFVLETYRQPGNTKNLIMLADAAFDKIPPL